MIANWLFVITCVVLAFAFIFYAIWDLIFTVYFSMNIKNYACWNGTDGTLHVSSRHIYFHSNDGKKRFAINSNEIVDVETSKKDSNSSYIEIYFLIDIKIRSERFYSLNSERIYKNIKKLFGI